MNLSPEFLHGLEIPRYTSALGRKKLLQLLTIAIQEFLQHGFTNTSTNRIMHNSGLSKGTLFNMFGSKKGLYLYLIKHSTVTLLSVCHRKLSTRPADFLQRLRWLGEVYLDLFIQEPAAFRLLMTIDDPGNQDMAAEFAREHAVKAAKIRQLMFDNITQNTLNINREQIRRITAMILTDVKQRLSGQHDFVPDQHPSASSKAALQQSVPQEDIPQKDTPQKDVAHEILTDLLAFRSGFLQDLDAMLAILRHGVYFDITSEKTDGTAAPG
ncbi:TetR/AcrR family transcriptional regulator [Salinispira pacifica]|uniref:Transcriptional regulator, TetR family n=1 Tax=Salinispira pacifica TaxID=1307761 RepID=V5WID1_9SPIO|nr:TetR/AcrR family transcriptional regulator [Salinispira pacifica]AHC15324.1 Transcriptional regulator, TetR family [Salinispira pacifica]